MADPATHTTYPDALDLLPAIGPNTHEDDPDVEHDRVHDRANALLNALQGLIGTTHNPVVGSVIERLLALEAGGGGSPGGVTADLQVLDVLDGEVVVDCAAASYFTLLLDQSVTSLTLVNPPSEDKGATIRIRCRQDGSGGHTLALPGVFRLLSSSESQIALGALSYSLVEISAFGGGERWETSIQHGQADVVQGEPHRYWSINVSEVNGEGFIGIQELEMLAGGVDQCGSGQPSATSTHFTSSPSLAFDGDWSDVNSAWVSDGVTAARLVYDFGQAAPTVVQAVRLAAQNQANLVGRGPRAFSVEWSDDGAAWEVAGSFTGVTWVVNTPQTFEL